MTGTFTLIRNFDISQIPLDERRKLAQGCMTCLVTLPHPQSGNPGVTHTFEIDGGRVRIEMNRVEALQFIIDHVELVRLP